MVSEIVVMAIVPTHIGQSTKLQTQYKGPITVIEVLPGDVYRVMQLKEDPKRQFITTAHMSQLKSWKIEEENSQSSTGGEKDGELINPGLSGDIEKPRRSTSSGVA